MNKLTAQSLNITNNEDNISVKKHINTDAQRRPIDWKCGAASNPPLHEIALRHRAERLKREAEAKKQTEAKENG